MKKIDWGLFWRLAVLKAMALVMMTCALMIPTGLDIWSSFLVNATIMFALSFLPIYRGRSR